MIKIIRCFVACCSIALATNAYGDIALSVDSDGGSEAQTGRPGTGKTIDIYLGQFRSSTADGDETFSSALGNFEFSSAAVTDVLIGSTEPNTNNGFLGEGNLSVSAVEINDDATGFTFNQEYSDSMQEIPTEPDRVLWLSIELDTTDLADGNYAFSVQSENGDRGSFRVASGSFVSFDFDTALSFTVDSNAVPEPSNFMFAGIMSAACGLRRKRSI